MMARKAGERRFGNALVGFVGVVLLLAVTATSFMLDSLPVIGAGPKYTAHFSEAAGLESGNEVRIAGVKVGVVTSVDLEDDRVEVDFRSKGAWIGDDTRASIQIKTVLGQKFLALEPAGNDELDTSDPIPVERTVAPYDVVTAFSSAAETIESIDEDMLEESLVTLSETFEASPEEFRHAIDGVARISQTISSRDQELRQLLEATRESSRIVAERNDDFRRLIIGAGELLAELNERRDALNVVLASTRALSSELRVFVEDNEEEFGPTLDSLDSALGILVDHEEDLRKGIHNLGPLYTVYSNIFGNGRWFDSYITNLVPPSVPEPAADTIREPARLRGIN